MTTTVVDENTTSCSTATNKMIAWDPMRPSALYVVTAGDPSAKAAGQDNNNNNKAVDSDTTAVVHTLFSDTGTGCNVHELTALLQLVMAHDDFKQHGGSHKRRTMQEVRQLFRTYRAAVSDCVSEWDQEQKQQWEQDSNMDEQHEASDDAAFLNLELLKTNYAVLHLSSVFLPLLPSQQGSGWDDGDDRESSWSPLLWQDPYAVPGLATADMVRYLRHNHILDVEQEESHSNIAAMLQAEQPDCYNETLYWQVVTKLVLRGCLEQAWTQLLSKHSLFVAATKFVSQQQVGGSASVGVDPHYAATLKEVERGFWQLRELLLRAPLPGGRTDERDNDLDNFGDWDDQEQLEDMQDEPATVYLLDDLLVTASDYKFWEPSNNSMNSSGTNADMPMDFQGHTAKRKHQQWQDYVKDIRQGRRHQPSSTSTSLLVRHIPQIDDILAILLGDFSLCTFSTWAERLLAELLYLQPDIKPCHVGRRTRCILSVQQDLDDDSSHATIIESFLHVMDGNAGQAVELLAQYGGDSGAALPSTLLALLFSLFVDAAILPGNQAELKTDFLCQAAWAIQSSLGGDSINSKQQNRDMGVQLAVRLLLPYAMPTTQQQDDEINAQRVRATVAQIMEHYSPTTYHFAKTLISHCHPLIERKSLQILEACTSVLLNLYPRQMREYDMEAAVLTLLDGMELEALVLPNKTLGACYRTLTRTCLETVDNLLKCALGESEPESERSHFVAQAMATAFKQHPVVKVEEIPDAMLVARTLPLFDALVLGQHMCAMGLLSQALAVDRDPTTENVTLRNLHWNFLRLAKNLLLKADVSEHMASDVSFDKDGILLLMETLTQLTVLPSSCPYSNEQVQELEEAFAHGLARAFVVENSRKKSDLMGRASRDGREELAGIQTSNMATYSLHSQEQFVQDLLVGI